MILSELPAPILRLSIKDLVDWVHGCDFAELIAEADCKEQFNKKPAHIISATHEASEWLAIKKR